MSFKGKFEPFTSLRKGGRKAYSFILTCKNMFLTETFDCAILDNSGQQSTQFFRHERLKANESRVFNIDTCGWDWCQGDSFVILDKKNHIKKHWSLNLKIFARGECPECHGNHKCVNCNGLGVIKDIHTHTISSCRACDGTGICQKCYVPVRLGTNLANEVYNGSSIPDSSLSREKRIAALHKTISELQAKIEKVEWDARMMQRKGTDVSSHMVYSSQLELKHQYQRQLLQAQHELQQLELTV